MKKYFQFEELGTNYRREIIGGITTFLAMAYILVVNPITLTLADVPDLPAHLRMDYGAYGLIIVLIFHVFSEEKIKMFSLQIANQYEKFVGREVMSLAVIDSLVEIIHSKEANTVAEAIAVYKKSGQAIS